MSDKSAAKKDSDYISFLDLVLVIVKNWKFIFFSTLVAAVFIVGYSIVSLLLPSEKSFLPNVFTPKVVVRLSENSGAMSALSGSSSLSLFSGLAGISEGPSNADLSLAILKGPTLVDQITEEFDFINRFGITEDPVTQSRDTYNKKISTDYMAETGLLTIGFTDIHAPFATDVVNFTLNKLEERFKELTLETVRSKKIFLETRLDEVEKDLETARNNLIEFQLKYGIYNLAAQGQVMLTEVTRITSQMVLKELEINELKKTWDNNSAPVRSAERELDQLETLLKVKKQGFESISPESVSSTEYIPQKQLPEVAVIYADLTTEIGVHTSIKTLLRQEYETTKLEELDNSKMFQVVERASIPEVKSGPSRGKLSIIFTFVCFFLSILISFFREYLHNAKKDPEESEKLSAIKEHFPIKFKRKK